MKYLVSMILAAIAAAASGGTFEDDVARILDEVTTAASEEQLLPVLLRYEDPRLSQVVAEYYSTTVDVFQADVLEGFAQATQKSDVSDFHIFADYAVADVFVPQPWVVVSYTITIMVPGQEVPTLCNRLVFHQDNGVTHVAIISDRLTARLAKSALPELIRPIDEVPALCPARIS